MRVRLIHREIQLIDAYLAWVMTCTQYYGAIERLYADPYFQLPENRQAREELHELFKNRTRLECLEFDV